MQLTGDYDGFLERIGLSDPDHECKDLLNEMLNEAIRDVALHILLSTPPGTKVLSKTKKMEELVHLVFRRDYKLPE